MKLYDLNDVEATLKTRIEDYKPAATSEEGGVVISSADGIVEVEGMDTLRMEMVASGQEFRDL